MTKKEQLVKAALDCFSKNGYDKTPTSLIAKKAGVSESLIYIHFKNKEDLLNVVIEQGFDHLKTSVSNIKVKGNPFEYIHLFIDEVILHVKGDIRFWKLIIRLIYQSKTMSDRLVKQFEVPIQKIAQLFAEKGYANPEFEVQMFLIILFGILKYIIQKEEAGQINQLVALFKSKYPI